MAKVQFTDFAACVKCELRNIIRFPACSVFNLELSNILYCKDLGLLLIVKRRSDRLQRFKAAHIQGVRNVPLHDLEDLLERQSLPVGAL